jgi:hypothetical protein
MRLRGLPLLAQATLEGLSEPLEYGFSGDFLAHHHDCGDRRRSSPSRVIRFAIWQGAIPLPAVRSGILISTLTWKKPDRLQIEATKKPDYFNSQAKIIN